VGGSATAGLGTGGGYGGGGRRGAVDLEFGSDPLWVQSASGGLVSRQGAFDKCGVPAPWGGESSCPKLGETEGTDVVPRTDRASGERTESTDEGAPQGGLGFAARGDLSAPQPAPDALYGDARGRLGDR